jgi:hypothetical protein
MSFIAVLGGIFVHPRRHTLFALVKITGIVLILGLVCLGLLQLAFVASQHHANDLFERILLIANLLYGHGHAIAIVHRRIADGRGFWLCSCLVSTMGLELYPQP